MAMQLDFTTVFRTKCQAVLAATATDVTTQMRIYLNTLIADPAKTPVADLNTRTWTDLPKT